jgi:hypothetical protein
MVPTTSRAVCECALITIAMPKSLITSLFAGSVVIYLLYPSKQRQIYGQSRLFATDIGPDRYRSNTMSGQPIGKQATSESY